MKDYDGELCFTDDSKKWAWEQHCENLVNIKFPWPTYKIPIVRPTEGFDALFKKEDVPIAI